MLKLNIQCTRFKNKYNTYTSKNNEVYVTIVEAFRKKEKKEKKRKKKKEKRSFSPLMFFFSGFWQTNEILLNLYMKC